MLSNTEIRSGFTIQEVSPNIVMPLREVVRIAMERIHREGTTEDAEQEEGKRYARGVTIECVEEGRIYHLTDYSVQSPGDSQGTETVSIGSLEHGLFIEGMDVKNADTDGNPLTGLLPTEELFQFHPEVLVSLQLPRSISFATKETLYHLRGCEHDAIIQLSQNLANGRRVDAQRYNDVRSILQNRIPTSPNILSDFS